MRPLSALPTRIRQWRRQRLIRREPIPESLWRDVTAGMPLLAGLSQAERGRLRDWATLFLAEKAFYGVDTEVSEALKVAVAAHAGLMVLGLDYALLSGWHTIVVYSGGFRARYEAVDVAGVVHVEESALSGEAWLGGPLVLSEEDVWASAAELDGFNLVIHELSHKLDMLNGTANGHPPLHGGMRVAHWAAAFSDAYRHFRTHPGRAHGEGIDPYAAESPAEFFAVLSETFFELPAVLQAAYPAVYAQLKAYYRQDPLQRLSTPAQPRPRR